MNALASVLLSKFAQPSSWAGLGALLALVGVNMPSSTVALITQVGAGVCGLAAIVVNEKSAAK